MRILMLHSRYLSGAASGENRVVDNEVAVLREEGHEVATWFPAPHPESRVGQAHLGLRTVWSGSSVSTVRSMAREFEPDLIHLHNLFPMLSPSVIREASRVAPVVMTLHNYRLMCLPATFLRDGRPCQECLGKKPTAGVLHRCYRNSAAGSAALASSMVLHRLLGTFGHVSLFLAVSHFLANKHIEAGLERTTIEICPNFSPPVPKRRGPGDHFLFAGRLAPEKDLITVLRSWKPEFGRLVLLGDGPDAEQLRAMAPLGVDFVGSVGREAVSRWFNSARALIVPSLSFEGCPQSILEAYAAGVPVIANRVGAIPEFVSQGRSGLLIEPRNVRMLGEALSHLLVDRESIRLGEHALARWREEFAPHAHLARLERAYEQAAARVSLARD